MRFAGTSRHVSSRCHLVELTMLPPDASPSSQPSCLNVSTVPYNPCWGKDTMEKVFAHAFLDLMSRQIQAEDHDELCILIIACPGGLSSGRFDTGFTQTLIHLI